MENTDKKPKSVIISNDIHDRLKRYCKVKSHTMGGVIEQLITEFLDKTNIK